MSYQTVYDTFYILTYGVGNKQGNYDISKVEFVYRIKYVFVEIHGGKYLLSMCLNFVRQIL